MVIGIDYGSKLAGTTVIAFKENGRLMLRSSEKKQDADQMIIDFVSEFKPTLIGIDAPLSLPGVYTNPTSYQDYFYRACDKEAKAMSPMFLGGLTARAMKLKAHLNTTMVEVYPAQKAEIMGLKRAGYKSNGADYDVLKRLVEDSMEEDLPLPQVNTSHELDAILALLITLQVEQGNANKVGSPNEGVIYY